MQNFRKPIFRTAFLSFLLIGIPITIVWIVIAGAGFSSLHPISEVVASLVPAKKPMMPNLTLLLVQLIVVIACSRLVGQLFLRIGQPRVVGEMATGIALGPTLLGVLAPDMTALLFPVQTLGFLQSISQVGLIVFMFLVGLELDPSVLRERGRTALMASLASITLPFALGVLLAGWLYPIFGQANVGFTGFALFVGAAMSVTAFPVLAAIIKERGLIQTELGSLALACAAVGDIAAWLILAGVVIIISAGQNGSSLPIMLGTTAFYVLIMIKVVRPTLVWLLRRPSGGTELSQNRLALILVLLLCSAFLTEWLGIHALFGAFLAGAIMPRDNGLVGKLIARLEDFTVVMLLPLFFVFTGLRTDLRVLNEATALLACGLVTAAAVIGKIGGATVAARVTGVSWREAGALGILMNTRGLMELVILNIGLDIGVISPTIFSMFVIMAVGTTCMTVPLLNWHRAAGARATIHRSGAIKAD